MLDFSDKEIAEAKDRLVRNLPTLRKELAAVEERGLCVEVGDLSYGRVHVLYAGEPGRILRVGNFTSIGPDVKIFVGRQGIHPVDLLSVYPIAMLIPGPARGTRDASSRMFLRNLDVTIGSDVWIGANSIILAGVEIGHGSIVAAGAVVNKSIPPYSVYGGVPAKFIKRRFDVNICDELIDLAWWDFPLEILVRHAYEIFYEPDLSKVVDLLRQIKRRL